MPRLRQCMAFLAHIPDVFQVQPIIVVLMLASPTRAWRTKLQDPHLLEGRRRESRAYAQKKETHRHTLRRVKKHHHPEELKVSQLFKCIARRVRPPKLPEPDHLVEVAKEVFPPRMQLPVHVCDYFFDHSVQFSTTLAEIESCKSCTYLVCESWAEIG